MRDYLLTWVSAWQGKCGPSLVLTGRARSGKTGLVLGLAYNLVGQVVAERVPRFTLRFVTAYDLMAQLTSWQGREERFRQYLECDASLSSTTWAESQPGIAMSPTSREW